MPAPLRLRASNAERLAFQIARLPHFDEEHVHGAYPHVAELDFAIKVLLGELEEQRYFGDEHNWCHRRPMLLAVLRAVIESGTNAV
jgi:hypothetical protein